VGGANADTAAAVAATIRTVVVENFIFLTFSIKNVIVVYSKGAYVL
jgi:hypothetical protein